MDIYFAILNFTLAGAIGLIGVLTLNKVSEPKEVLFASLPFLFALHQFTEGFVWLGMDGIIPQKGLNIAAGIFVYYAQGILPFLVPFSLWLIEKNKIRKHLIGILTIFGLGLAIYIMYGLATMPTYVQVVNNVLFYYNPWTQNLYDAIIYLMTTCGALMISSSISIELFGLLNLIAVIVIYLFNPYGFTSVWCLYAAAISGLLYFYFVERRIKFLKELKKKEKEFSSKLEKELDELLKRRRK